MSTTTVTRPVRSTDESGTRALRAVSVVTAVAILVTVAFIIGRVTTHQSASVSPVAAQVGTAHQLSAANRAQIAGDVATLTQVGQVGQFSRLSPANRALITGDVALVPLRELSQLSPADRAIVANDAAVAPTTQLAAANPTVCRAGQPC